MDIKNTIKEMREDHKKEEWKTEDHERLARFRIDSIEKEIKELEELKKEGNLEEIYILLFHMLDQRVLSNMMFKFAGNQKTRIADILKFLEKQQQSLEPKTEKEQELHKLLEKKMLLADIEIRILHTELKEQADMKRLHEPKNQDILIRQEKTYNHLRQIDRILDKEYMKILNGKKADTKDAQGIIRQIQEISKDKIKEELEKIFHLLK